MLSLSLQLALQSGVDLQGKAKSAAALCALAKAREVTPAMQWGIYVGF